MSDPKKEKGTEPLSDKEFYELLLVEDERLHDEGRDLYMDEVMKKIRGDLEKEGE